MRQRYVLTERGKFLIAIFVAFLFVLSSLILVVWSFSRSTAANGLKPGSNGSGANPDIPYLSGEDSQGGNDRDPVSIDPSLSGPIAFDLEEGLLMFLFSPDRQIAIDDLSFSMIGDLVVSPLNTRNTKFAVELPQASDADTAIMTSAIIDAFTEHGVSITNITFLVYQPETAIRTFLINISFR